MKFAGGTAAVVNIASRYYLNQFISFEWAIVFAYIIGMLTAFLLSNYFVFENANNKTAQEAIRYIIVNIFALILVWVVSVLFANYIFPTFGVAKHAEDIAHIIAVCSIAVISYLGHKYFTFKAD